VHATGTGWVAHPAIALAILRVPWFQPSRHRVTGQAFGRGVRWISDQVEAVESWLVANRFAHHLFGVDGEEITALFGPACRKPG